MNRPRLALVAAVVVLAAFVAAGSIDRPRAQARTAPRSGVAAVADVTRVCPSVTGAPNGLATDMTVANVGGAPVTATYADLSGSRLKPTRLTLRPAAVVHRTTTGGAVVVHATGAGAADVVASQVALSPNGRARGTSDIACSAPGTDWWFAGADGRIGFIDLLVIANPADTAANVALSLWDSRGALNPPGVAGINVPARSAIVRPVAGLAPDRQWVAMHVHANSGTITAAVVDEHTDGIRAAGTDWIPPTQAPSTAGVMTGFLAYAGLDVVHLANPGTRDATVAFRVVTTSRNFVPAGTPDVVVPAGKTVAVNLTQAISGEVAAVAFHSDAPVVGAGITVAHRGGGFDETAWLPVQPALRKAAIAANEPPFGQVVQLVLTAPQGRASVLLRTPRGKHDTVVVPAGRTVRIDLRAVLGGSTTGAGPVLLEPVGAQPVYVSRILYASGAHGPLVAEEPPTLLPTSTVLPPATADLRAGTRQASSSP